MEEEIIVAPQPTAVKRNLLHTAIIIVLLVPLNYALYVTLKSTVSPPPNPNATVDEIISAAQRDTRQNPGFDSYLHLGMVYCGFQRYPLAKEAIEKALTYNAKSEVAYNDLAVISAGMGNLQDEVKYCEQALSINPDYQLAKNNLAWAKGELSKAAAPAGPPVPVQNGGGTDFASCLTMGLALFNNKEYERAIEVWKKALQYNPNSEVVYSNMGAAYGSMAKWNEEITCCEKALAINPDYTLARNNLAWAKSQLNNKK
jgi:tetratricopeptide (TPR) repeat protein